MFSLRKTRKVSPDWERRSPEELAEAALPLVSLALSALGAPLELIISPGAQESREFLDSALRLRTRVSHEISRPSDLDGVREAFERLAAGFGRWQRQQFEALVAEFAQSVEVLVSTANAAVDDTSSAIYGMAGIQKSLERVQSSDDIVEIRRVVSAQVDAARSLIQRQKISEQLHRQKVSERMKDMEVQLGALRSASHKDHLTSVGNRAAFDHYSALMMQKTREGQGPFCLALLDIDDLKGINDRFGHAAGDAALGQVAGEISRALGSAGYVARTGGDEFAVLFQGRAAAILRDLKEALEALRRSPVTVESTQGRGQLSVSFSAGIATFRADSLLQTILRGADEALYAAKSRGKGQIFLAPDRLAA